MGADRPASGPIVTLLSDFGLREPFVAVMKAQVLAQCPGAILIDLSHELPRYAPAAAGFWLLHASPWFPAGTVHLAVVDPGVGTDRRLLCVRARGQLFLGPDNGLLARLAALPGAATRVFDLSGPAGQGLPPASATFHGRDILAPLAGRLAAGSLEFEHLGSVAEAQAGEQLPVATQAKDGIHGAVELTDSFGNIFSNIRAELLVAYQGWTAELAGQPFRQVHSYGDARRGESVALINAWGLLELAVVEGNAAQLIGARRGMPILVRPAAKA